MMLLNFIPESIYHIFVFIGVCLIIGSYFIPLYKIGLQVGGVLLLSGGIYMVGYIDSQDNWQAQIEILKQESAKKDELSRQVTDKVVTQYVDRVKIIKEVGNDVSKKIQTYVTANNDNSCSIPESFVLLHDYSSRNQVPPAPLPVDERTSPIKLSEVMRTVAGNYTMYYEVAEQLKSLQLWVKEQEKANNGG